MVHRQLTPDFGFTHFTTLDLHHIWNNSQILYLNNALMCGMCGMYTKCIQSSIKYSVTMVTIIKQMLTGKYHLVSVTRVGPRCTVKHLFIFYKC